MFSKHEFLLHYDCLSWRGEIGGGSRCRMLLWLPSAARFIGDDMLGFERAI